MLLLSFSILFRHTSGMPTYQADIQSLFLYAFHDPLPLSEMAHRIVLFLNF